MKSERFEPHHYGCLDTHTGLKWSLETYGPMSWHRAVEITWRLPTISELMSIVDYSKSNPATGLPNMLSGHYWTSVSYINESTFAWFVHFGDGYVNYCHKTELTYVRYIRG